MKKRTVFVLVLGLMTWLTAGRGGEAAGGCFSTIATGAGASSRKFCISNHGNVNLFEAPAGTNHVSTDGYVVCSSGGGFVHGWDAGPYSEFGFGPAAIGQPNGPNKLPLTITRNSTDGAVRLKQRFAWDKVEGDLTITMTVTNRTAQALSVVRISRYVDADVGAIGPNDFYDKSEHGIWARDYSDFYDPGRPAITLTALGFGISHLMYVEGWSEWTANTQDTCSPAFPQATPAGPGDYVGRVTYTLGTINRFQSKTVRVVYRAQ